MPITFKSAADRDEVFGVLIEVLGSQYHLHIHAPKRWGHIFSSLFFLVPAILALGLALTARELETKGDWGKDSDILSAIIHGILKFICGLLGSNVLFGITSAIALFTIGVFVYRVVKTTPDLPTERWLRHKKLDYVGSSRKSE